MKKFLLLFFLLLTSVISYSQTAADYAVMLTAQVEESPPSITLYWNTYANATAYNIYRKTKSANVTDLAKYAIKNAFINLE